MKKNPAAVALGRRGGKARLRTLTPERRSQIAKKANAARWAKAKGGVTSKPDLWYRLWAFDPPARFGNGFDLTYNPPELLFFDRDEQKVHAFGAAAKARGDNRIMGFDTTDECPHRGGLRLTRKYAPDPRAQVKALQAVLQEGARK